MKTFKGVYLSYNDVTRENLMNVLVREPGKRLRTVKCESVQAMARIRFATQEG